ncbi:Hypothetical predicted protein [Podarcis lilfordi]|uniref:Uncharacterized protein n=1 Tax=Podarcis lilfordi TaxID=74358 RepID=A0AA35PHP9_9SAUR|nr:Hypothetical predicted protein [Podarcis lilfordi]
MAKLLSLGGGLPPPRPQSADAGGNPDAKLSLRHSRPPPPRLPACLPAIGGINQGGDARAHAPTHPERARRARAREGGREPGSVTKVAPMAADHSAQKLPPPE